jgi:hypothetical protein
VVPRAVRCARSVPTATVRAAPSDVRRDRRTRGPRGGRSTGRVTRRKAPLAVFAVFAANHQPSTSPSPRKSWAADGLANARTAAASAVLSLFFRCSFAVLRCFGWNKSINRKTGITAGDRFIAPSDRFSIPATISQHGIIVNLTNALLARPGLPLRVATAAAIRAETRYAASKIYYRTKLGSRGSPAPRRAGRRLLRPFSCIGITRVAFNQLPLDGRS